MKKEDFRKNVRAELRKVPRDIRHNWDEADLFIWRSKLKETDAYLRWELASGDVWQHVKGFFNDLIGEKSFARTACGGRFILFIGNLLKEIYGYENYECKSSYCCFKSTFQ